MKKTFFCVFFLIFLTLITCTVLSVKIEEEMTLEVIGYEKRESYDAFIPPKDMLFTDEEGSHLYEVYQGTGWESGLRAREISLYGGSFNVDRNYIVARGASRQPVYGERADLYDGKDTGPSTYVAYYPEGIPEENHYLSQAVILEQSDHVLLLYQENGIFPFTENRAKGGMVQLEGAGLACLQSGCPGAADEPCSTCHECNCAGICGGDSWYFNLYPDVYWRT